LPASWLNEQKEEEEEEGMQTASLDQTGTED